MTVVAFASSLDARIASDLMGRIDRLRTSDAVTDFMRSGNTQRALADLPEGLRADVREHARARMIALGWPDKARAGR